MSVFRRFREHGSYSAQRNSIHYADLWPYEDLYGPLAQKEIGLLPDEFTVGEEDPDQCLKLAQMMAYCSAHMMMDVLGPLPKFADYCAKFRLRLFPEWHPLLSVGALAAGMRSLRGSE
ncbi:MAG: hypothetical protein ACRD3W_00465 [Terriglobales bacterium]